ncbi:MAG: SDR family NAD(P)-dependent oxidoreductase, partial [Thermoplasmata archaeon]
GRRSELLDELKEKDPDSYFTRSFDISNTNKIEDHLEELTSELGGLDLLIISSGTGDINKKLDFEIEKKTIDTNVTGFTRIADWAFDHFQKQNYGHLVGITSVGGLRGSGESPSYNATKSYQMNYLEGLRQKAAKESERISITDIRPGLVDTAMAKGE